MQTFLPYPDFVESAKCLDDRRLGKQRVEAYQLLVARTRTNEGAERVPWTSHPAFRMWSDYPGSLTWYAMVFCNEWMIRGFSDSLHDKVMTVWKQLGEPFPTNPSWLGDERLHLSHQCNLMRKDYGHYSRQFDQFKLPESYFTEPYYWPVT